jgi:hypothetical protein
MQKNGVFPLNLFEDGLTGQEKRETREESVFNRMILI